MLSFFLIQLHWHPNEDPDHHDKVNIKEDLDNEVLTYTITGKFGVKFL